MTMYQCLAQLAGITGKFQKAVHHGVVEARGMIKEVVSFC